MRNLLEKNNKKTSVIKKNGKELTKRRSNKKEEKTDSNKLPVEVLRRLEMSY